MVRLPDQDSADKLLTVSHHGLLSVNVDMLDKADTRCSSQRRSYISLP